MSRCAVIGLLVLVSVASGCVMLRTCWVRMAGSIPAAGGKVLHIRLPDEGKTQMQKDKRWAADQLGHSDCTLGTHGCLVSSVAMACSNLGVKLTPKELNGRLKKADGYLPQGWVVWKAIPQVSGRKLAADFHSHPSHAVIDTALEHGAYPVAKYFLPGGIQHWCVIVGKVGDEYLARDPLRDDKEPVRLSTLTEKLHAVRVIRKAGDE